MGWLDLAEVYGFMLPSLYGLAWFSCGLKLYVAKFLWVGLIYLRSKALCCQVFMGWLDLAEV